MAGVTRADQTGLGEDCQVSQAGVLLPSIRVRAVGTEVISVAGPTIPAICSRYGCGHCFTPCSRPIFEGRFSSPPRLTNSIIDGRFKQPLVAFKRRLRARQRRGSNYPPQPQGLPWIGPAIYWERPSSPVIEAIAVDRHGFQGAGIGSENAAGRSITGPRLGAVFMKEGITGPNSGQVLRSVSYAYPGYCATDEASVAASYVP